MSIAASSEPQRERKPRRRFGALVDPVYVSWRIERSTKERAEAIARRADVSPSELIDLAIAHLELTDQGIPQWMPERSRDGELPIDVP